jgi:hypothetical protein
VVSDTRYYTTFAKQVERKPPAVRLSWLGLLWLSLLTSSSIHPPVPIPDCFSPSSHVVTFMMDIFFQCRPLRPRAALPVDLTALCRVPIVIIASRLFESSSLSALETRNLAVCLYYVHKDQPLPAEFSAVSQFVATLTPNRGSHGKCVPYAVTMFANSDFRFEANTLESNEITRDSQGTIVLYPSLTHVWPFLVIHILFESRSLYRSPSSLSYMHMFSGKMAAVFFLFLLSHTFSCFSLPFQNHQETRQWL